MTPHPTVPTYYRNETLFSEIYLEEITQQPEQTEILASLKVLQEYRDYAKTSSLKEWKESFIHEILSALGFYAKSKDDHLSFLFPMGNTNNEKPLSVCYSVLPNDNLDNTTIGRNWAEKIIRALRENNLHWGLLTNGNQWRIYHLEESTPYETSLEVDLEAIFKEKAKEAYQIFYKFMKAENFTIREDGRCQFDQFKKESQDKIDYIEKELANALKQREEGGKGVLSDLCLGYVEAVRHSKEIDLDDETDRRKIYHGAMLYMFRLLFLFYADSRSLLSEANHALLASVEEDARAITMGKPGSETSYTLWERLSTIFVDIDQTYNGGLFSPQESEFTKFIEETHVADRFLAGVFFNLTTYHEKDGQEHPISYRDMSVRHLGTLYEGLLEHKLFITSEDTEVRVTKGSIEFIPASQGGKLVKGHYLPAGAVYFGSDPSERKSTGSYYTPEYIVDYIVRNTVGEKLKALKEEFQTQELANLKALGQAVHAEERAALSGLLEENALKFLREKVLRLSVLDPAMGSGHFLVNATNLITNYITEFLNDLGIESDTPSGAAYWRRWVVENCIYGVDLNPLAVDLAKLTLWILSMAKEQPLSFMNHHLKCGNSLIGARLEEIGNYPFSTEEKEPKQLNLFERDPDFRAAVEDALAKSRMIASHASTSLSDVEEKKTWLAEIEEDLQGYKAICDVHTGLYSANVIDKNEYRSIVQERDYEKAKALTVFSKHFHWELEFPETFLKSLTNQVNGFDVIVGNPPYLGESGHKEVFRSISRSPWGAKYYQRKMDLFYFFFHLALDLTKESALVCFITTNYYVTADGAAFLRSELFKHATIIQLVNLQDLKIFSTASGQHNIISMFQKGKNLGIPVKIFISNKIGYANEKVFADIISGKEKDTDFFSLPQNNIFEGKEHYIRLHGTAIKYHNQNAQQIKSIFEIIDNLSIPLSQYSAYIFKGVETGCDILTELLLKTAVKKGLIDLPTSKLFSIGEGIYVLNKQELINLNLSTKEYADCIKPFYKNSEIHRFFTPPNNSRYLVYVDSSTNINLYPGIKKHLLQFRSLLAAREQAVIEERNWFWIRGSKRNSILYRPEFIVVPSRSKTSRFSLCHQDIYCAGDVYYISPKKDFSTLVLLGYLNSSLVFYHLFFRGKRKGEIIEYFKTPLEQIPINSKLFQPDVSKSIEHLVNLIIEHKANGDVDTASIENQIDNLIFDLFSLSKSEIRKIVELEP